MGAALMAAARRTGSRALRTMRGVAAQSEADASRFRRLGARAEQVTVCGNLKFDTRVDPAVAPFAEAFRARFPGRPVWIAASTHPDEESAALAIDRHLRSRWPDLLTARPSAPSRARHPGPQVRALRPDSLASQARA